MIDADQTPWVLVTTTINTRTTDKRKEDLIFSSKRSVSSEVGFSLLSDSSILWIMSLNNDPNDWISSAILVVMISIIHFTIRDPMSDSRVDLSDSSSLAAFRSRRNSENYKLS